MNARIGLAAVALGWLSFGALAGAERSRLVPDDPVMRAGLEAEMASRVCPGVKVDVEAFKAYARANGMNHADFYVHPRSRELQTRLAGYKTWMRHDHDAACGRLWTDYGTGGGVVQLLRRA